MTREWTQIQLTDQDGKALPVYVWQSPGRFWYATFKDWEPGAVMGEGTTQDEAIGELLAEYAERQP
jgi:hypothetical protein